MINMKEICLQGEPSECALASLSHISRFSSEHITLPSLRKYHNVSSLGTTLHELVELSTKIGVKGRAIYFDHAFYDKLPTPCIIHLNTNHYVVLEKVNSAYSIVMNPALGRQTIKNDIVLMGVSGYAVVFDELIAPTNTHVKRTKFNLSAQLILLGLSTAVLSTIIPAYLFSFDNFTADKQFNMNLLILFIISQITVLLLVRLFLKERLKIEAKTLVSYTDKLYHKLLSNKIFFFEKRNPSDTTNKLMKAVAANVSRSTLFNDFFISGTQLLLSVAVLVALSPTLALVVIFFSLLACLVSNMEKGKVSLFNHMRQEFDEKIFKTINESSDVIYDIKSSQQSSAFANLLRRVLVDYANFNVSSALNLYKYSAIKGIMAAVETVCVFYICFQLTQRDEISLAYIFIIFFMRQITNSAIDDITSKYISLGEIQNSEERGRDISEFDSETLHANSTVNHINNDDIEGLGLSLLDVSFKYSNNIISYDNEQFANGSVSAITGDSGSGKTTLLKIIAGFYAQYDGEIEYNGMCLSDSERRSRFYYHASNQKFFSGTLRQNMTMNNDALQNNVLHHYIQHFELETLISRLPDGLNTLISESTHPFSDGEKSRLLLCRAFVSSAVLLLIDEPTKSLDQNMTKKVIAQIYGAGRTVLFTSHDIDQLSIVDQVISL
ncbi:ATP-binding cassette domain-containing protein [Aeromonas sp. 604534]|uniref:ATP-binding cassette domain-containing protein n=2 Tax=Aeromonadaceae TaxID=84642 RepID=UPI003B9EFA4B